MNDKMDKATRLVGMVMGMLVFMLFGVISMLNGDMSGLVLMVGSVAISTIVIFGELFDTEDYEEDEA